MNAVKEIGKNTYQVKVSIFEPRLYKLLQGPDSEGEICLFNLILYIPVNNFLVMSGRVLLG